MWGAAPILFWCARCSGTLVWARSAAATPVGAAPAASPPPASRSLLGGGASPRLRGGGGPLLWLPSWGGCGGGGGGAAPPSPPPRRASACLPLPPACPPGVYSCRGGCRAASGVGRGPGGRRRVSAAGGGGGKGGGDPPPWFAPPSSPGRPLIRPLRLRRIIYGVNAKKAGRSNPLFFHRTSSYKCGNGCSHHIKQGQLVGCAAPSPY